MRTLQSRIVSVIIVAVLTAAAAWTTQADTAVESSGMAQTAPDLIFWYDDSTYDTFFTEAAAAYLAETGIKVQPQYIGELEYLQTVYDSTMEDGVYPDVWLVSADCLETAYLCGLAARNEKGESYAQTPENARRAASYGDKLLGYPLSFNTCVFVYQSSYFEKAPSTMQEIIDYSNENEPGENVEYLVEWDVKDPFYDFPFVANSITFETDGGGQLRVVRDEEKYSRDLEFFETLLAAFSVNAETVSEEAVLENFKAGKTLCAILDTDSLCQLEDYADSVTQIPDLNEELNTSVCAMTDLLVVNDFSEKQQLAADFAEFVTVDFAPHLHETSGHYSVFLPEQADRMAQTAFEVYKDAILAPSSQAAADFWIDLKETMTGYFE